MGMVVDAEKGIKESVAAPDAQIPAIAAGGEKELANPDLPIEIDEGIVAGNINPRRKKWRLPYWLLVTTTSVILLTNSEDVATLTIFLCAICLMLRDMKQMM